MVESLSNVIGIILVLFFLIISLGVFGLKAGCSVTLLTEVVPIESDFKEPRMFTLFGRATGAVFKETGGVLIATAALFFASILKFSNLKPDELVSVGLKEVRVVCFRRSFNDELTLLVLLEFKLIILLVGSMAAVSFLSKPLYSRAEPFGWFNLIVLVIVSELVSKSSNLRLNLALKSSSLVVDETITLGDDDDDDVEVYDNWFNESSFINVILVGLKLSLEIKSADKVVDFSFNGLASGSDKYVSMIRLATSLRFLLLFVSFSAILFVVLCSFLFFSST